MTRKKAPEGPITCLYTDIEGSTPLSETHPNEWKRVSGEHDRILAECIWEAKGHPERPEGDSFFATFRDASSALNCAIAIQEHLNPDGKPCLLVQKENGEAQPVRVPIGVYRVTEAVYLTTNLTRTSFLNNCRNELLTLPGQSCPFSGTTVPTPLTS